MRKIDLPFLGTLFALATAPYTRAESITEFLRAFHHDPARMMERLPSVVDDRGVAKPQGFIDHDALALTLAERLRVRSQLMGLSLQGLTASPPAEGGKDSVDKLVEPGSSLEKSLPGMQAQGLTNLSAPVKPWADSYWPTYRGQIAYRYSDPSAPKTKSWSANHAFFESSPPEAIASSGDASLINRLSPAEKYDFVMGDLDFTLTRFAWSRGRKTSEDGGVATWMGICHGWAAAAHMGVPFVGQPVTVLAQSGIPVAFYPQDIKALQSMLWANGSPTARFVGGRCGVSRPARNTYGRVLDEKCFDTNPATWHLAVVNQLGRNGRGFVFDGTYDAEVWNFPLQSVRYRTFNPQTLEETSTVAEAEVPIERFRIDKFREFRSRDARYVAGVYMDVTYVIEIEPGSDRVFDAPTKTVRYIYDLELDAGHNIVGGEWYSNAHPDFLWTFEPAAQAMAFDENVILDDPWSNASPVPLAWTSTARKASARGIPLYGFLKKVIEAAGPVYQP